MTQAAEAQTQQARPPSAKRVKFVNLAEKRTIKTIKAIRQIGNLTQRPSTYEYGDLDAKKIIDALQAEVDALAEKFGGPKVKPQVEFSL